MRGPGVCHQLSDADASIAAGGRAVHSGVHDVLGQQSHARSGTRYHLGCSNELHLDLLLFFCLAET